MAMAVLQVSTPEPTQPDKQDILTDQKPIVQAQPKHATLDSGLPVPDMPALEPPPPQRSHSGTLLTRTNSNARAEPSTSAEKVAVIPKGATVTLIASEGEWRQVAYGDVTGWVRGDNFQIP